MLKFIGTLVVLGVLAVAGAYQLVQIFEDADVVVGDEPVTIEIAAGMGASAAVDYLINEGVLEDDFLWRPWLLMNRPGCLQAGVHRLPAEGTPAMVFAALCQTTYAEGIRFTVPEGTNLFELDQIAVAAAVTGPGELLAAANDSEVLASIGIQAGSAEGFLFPDTYELPLDVDAVGVLSRMHQRWREQWDAAVAAHPNALQERSACCGMGTYDLLILASLVEAEAVVAEERPMIAAAFYNRMRDGMRLQTDPTCVYGPDTFADVPRPEHCHDPGQSVLDLRDRWFAADADQQPGPREHRRGAGSCR